MPDSKDYMIGDELPVGFLSSPQIEYCIRRYEIVKDARLENVKSAVYVMGLGEYATRWEAGKKLEFFLGDDFKICYPYQVPQKYVSRYLELPPNSLTFVTTFETFNLARNLVARFNLKSSWVHKGLLLGTGPIVDPGFQSKIVIPLHNLSNNHIYIEYKENLINVEFTKTQNPNLTSIMGTHVSPLHNTTKNKHFNEYFKATEYTESSIKSNIEDINKNVYRIKNFGYVTFIALVISFLALLFYVLNVVYESNSLIFSTRKNIEGVKNEIISGDIDKMQQMREKLDIHSSEIKALQTKDSNNDQIQELFERVRKLEQKSNINSTRRK